MIAQEIQEGKTYIIKLNGMYSSRDIDAITAKLCKDTKANIVVLDGRFEEIQIADSEVEYANMG